MTLTSSNGQRQDGGRRTGSSGCPFHPDRSNLPHGEYPYKHPFAFSFADVASYVRRLLSGQRSDTDAAMLPGYLTIPELHASKRQLVAELYRNPVAAFQSIRREYGDTVQYRLPNDQLLIATSNPHIIRAVLLGTDRGTGPADTSDKSATIADGTQHVFGDHNIVADSNERWKSQRAALGQTFSRTIFDQPLQIAQIQRTIDGQIDALKERIENAPDGAIKVELQHELSKTTLRVALSVIFGKSDVSDETIERIHTATRSLLEGFPLEASTPFSLPYRLLGVFSDEYAKMSESQGFLLSFAEELLKAEEQNPSDPPNALTRMVDALNASTPLLDRQTVLNNIRVLLVAGHETSGNVLAYALASLASHPNVLDPVVRESLAVPWEDVSTLTGLRDTLPRAREVVEESLRLHPPFYILLRRTTADLTIETPKGIVLIPKDTELALDVFGSQRAPEQWGGAKTGYDAEEFSPTRWSQENRAARGLTERDMELFSFGLGSRVCLGAHMFWAEALLLLAKFTREFEITPQFDNADAHMNGDLSLQREGGYAVQIRLRARKNS